MQLQRQASSGDVGDGQFVVFRLGGGQNNEAQGVVLGLDNIERSVEMQRA